MITLTQALAFFDEAEELSVDSRALSERCRDYYDNKQWTSREAGILRSRKQPVITRNRIKPKVDFLKGIELQTRTDPEAAPRTPHDEEAAQAATDAVRYVYDKNQFPKKKSEVFENLVIEGFGGVEVFVKDVVKRDGTTDTQICIKRFQWDRLGFDPHSRELDFSDSLYRYGVVWMDFDKAAERYPGKEGVLSSTISSESLMSTTYDDTPRLKWSDARRKRVRICKLEYKHGCEVYVCEFTRSGFLSDPEPSPYVDVDGVPDWSIILQSSHVDREGNRYGYVKPWLDIQDEINKRGSKHLHLVSVRQTFSTEGAANDVQKLKSELNKPDGHLKFQRGEFGKDFGVLPTNDQANAQFQLLQEAKQEIDSVGVNAAMAGTDERQLSGNAIRKLQQGASTELKPLFECIAQFDNNVCRTVWNRIKQFWTAEKWIRITGDDQSPTWVGLNVPILDEAGEVVGIKNNVAEMDVDFSIVEVPDTVNSQQEQFEALTAIYPSIPDDQKAAAFELLVESSTLRNKKKVLERLKGDRDQATVDMQKKMMELNAALLEAKVAREQAQAQKAEAEKIVKMVEALYASMQAAQTAATVPGVVPIADEIVKSAGFKDQNAAPVYPAPVAPAAAAMPGGDQNTSPMFPDRMQGPGAGMMQGIETQRNDGFVQ